MRGYVHVVRSLSPSVRIRIRSLAGCEVTLDVHWAMERLWVHHCWITRKAYDIPGASASQAPGYKTDVLTGKQAGVRLARAITSMDSQRGWLGCFGMREPVCGHISFA